jgi:hypothetical protein
LEVTRLTSELVQEAVAFKDLRITTEEKDATILEVRETAETARADVEMEKKQVEGRSPP